MMNTSQRYAPTLRSGEITSVCLNKQQTSKPFEYYLARQDYLSEIRARDRYRRHRRNHYTREERKLEIRIAIGAFCFMVFICVCAHLALRATFPSWGW